MLYCICVPDIFTCFLICFFLFLESYHEVRLEMTLETIIGSSSADFSKIICVTDSYIPALNLWVGDYPHLNKIKFKKFMNSNIRNKKDIVNDFLDNATDANDAIARNYDINLNIFEEDADTYSNANTWIESEVVIQEEVGPEPVPISVAGKKSGRMGNNSSSPTVWLEGSPKVSQLKRNLRRMEDKWESDE